MGLLHDLWPSAGLAPGDTVLLHSNTTRLMYQGHRQGEKLTPPAIAESLLEYLGPDGTLLVPTFNYSFTKGVEFSLRETPSEMGALTEYVRCHSASVRTGHPVNSFAVIGRQQPRFAGLNNFSGYGLGSPFELLRELDGKIAALDLADQQCMTFYHHIEELHRVPYRFAKQFSGWYRDLAGERRWHTCELYVSDLDRGVRTHLAPAEDRLWELGLYQGSRAGTGLGLRAIPARAMFAAVSELIRNGLAEQYLYRIVD